MSLCSVCGRKNSSQHGRFCIFKKEDIENVRKLYNIEKLSAREIVAKGFNKTLVCFSLRGRRRSTSESNKLAQEKYPRKLSDETKKRISDKRKKWLNEHKDQHNWRYNFESYPEKIIRQFFETLQIDVIAEYTPHDFDRHFKIDFAIINKKIAIEINGNQHYKRNGDFNDYHINRQSYIMSKGWLVVNIPAVNVVKDFENVKLQLKSLLENPKSISFNVIKTQKDMKKNKDIEKKQLMKQIELQKQQKQKQIILQTIEAFGNKFGIIGEIAQKLNITHTHVARLIKKFDIKVFKRLSCN